MSSSKSIFFVLLIFISISSKAQTLEKRRYEIEPSSVKLLNNCYPIIKGTLNGLEAFYLVDTGSTITVLDISQKKQYGFYIHKKINKRLLGFGGKHMGVSAILNVDMRIGERFIATPFLGVPLIQLKEHIYNKTGYNITGIIGSDVILGYGIIVDFVSKKCLIGVGKNLIEKKTINPLVSRQFVY